MKIEGLRPRWRKIISDLWDNKIRTLLVVLSVAIGVFAVGVIAGAYVIIANDLNASYYEANPANIEIITDSFSKDFLTTIERLPNVKEVEARRELAVRFKVNEEQWDALTLIAQPDYANSKINQLLPYSGEQFPPDNKVVLERKTLEYYGFHVGDILEIELSDGTKKNMEIAGANLDRTIGYGAFMGENKGYISDKTIEWLRESFYYDQIFVTVKENQDDRDAIEQVALQIKDHLEKGGRQVYRTNIVLSHKHPLDSIIRALLGVLLILGTLVVFLSGSLIINTLNALLSQHTGQIGVMKLVGAQSRQINWLYILLILSFSGISLAISVPTGNIAALALSNLAAELLNVVLKPHTVILPAIILQVIIAVGVPVFAGIFPVRNGTKITVHKAINAAGIEEIAHHSNFLENYFARQQFFSRPVMISLRNTFRKKKRLALTLFNLALGGASFISVFNVQAALNNKIEQTTYYFQADVNLELVNSIRINEIHDIGAQIPEIEKVEGWVTTSGEFLKEDDSVLGNIVIFGPPNDTKLITPVMIKGRWLLPDDENGIVLNETILKVKPDLLPGDNIKIKINGDTKTWIVVGIIQFTGMDELYAYTNFTHLSKLLKMSGQASSYRVVTYKHTLDDQIYVRDRLNSLLSDRGIKVSDIQAGNTQLEGIIGYINILIIFLLIMALLTAAVGSIGLAGTLGMNVMERTREIGVMRAIGAYDSIIIQMVVIEGLLISGLSYLLGVIFSFPITNILSQTVSLAIFNSPASFTYTYLGFLIWLVIATLLSVLASMIPARRASHMTIREVLAYE